MEQAAASRMLEDVVQPRRVLWLSCGLEQVNGRCRVDVAAHVAMCLVRHGPIAFAYAREVAILHAWLLEEADKDVPCVCVGDVLPAECRSRVAPEPSPGHEHGLRRRLRGGDASADHVRMHVFGLVTHALAACTHVVSAMPNVSAPVALRVRRLITQFANECTFKVHGDACIHHEVVTCVLAPWASAVMARHESPYALATFAYPTDVNAVIRPIIETPPRDRITASMWHATRSASSTIVVFHVLAEIIGRREFRVLSNSNILRHTSNPAPMPFVYRRFDGTTTCGVRAGDVFEHFPDSATLVEVVVRVLESCRLHNYSGASDACEAVLDDVIGVANPLAKFAVR